MYSGRPINPFLYQYYIFGFADGFPGKGSRDSKDTPWDRHYTTDTVN